MDNPGLSVFQDAGINIENVQSLEEEEDIEEQMRRQKELQNLLTNALDDFKYEDSTMNSSTNASMISNQNFKDVPLDDQLKVLYDVRVREINSLRQEFDNYKDEKEKEINSFKQKLLLYEAEVRHLHTSLQNVDSLIEEKIMSIKKLEEVLQEKDELIDQLRKENEQSKLDIGAYKMAVDELQLKLNNTNPLYLGSRRFQSEELQKAHQEQIEKLEASLQEQRAKAQCLEQEKKHLQDEFDKVHNNSKQIETNTTKAITYFSTNFNNVQQQCGDLVDVVEALSKENELFRKRLLAAENNTPLEVIDLQTQHVDYNTISQHVEKLRQMLLVKDTELSTLKTKLRFYDRDIRDLMEYRNIKNNISNFDFNACGDMSNNHQNLILQNELKHSKILLTEKDNHIASLQLVNEELHEKIKKMLEETRSNIENISHKYSLPQLEKMSEDFNEAQNRIAQLEHQLALSESKEKELIQLNHNFEDRYKCTKTDLERVQAELLSIRKVSENGTQRSDCTIKDLKTADDEVKRLQKILTEFKSIENELKEHNVELECDLRDAKSKIAELQDTLKTLDGVSTDYKNLQIECNKLKQQVDVLSDELEQLKYHKSSQDNCILETHAAELASANSKIANLEEGLQEQINTKTIIEGEKADLEYRLKELQDKFQAMQAEPAISKTNACGNKSMEAETFRKSCQVMHDTVTTLEGQINILQKGLLHRDDIIAGFQKENLKLETALEDARSQLADAREEIVKLQKKCVELSEEVENKKTKEAVHNEEIVNRNDNKVLQGDLFKNLIQAEVLKCELEIQDKFEKQYIKTADSFEEKYQQIVLENCNRYKTEIEELRKRECNYRSQLGQILSECGKKISEMEDYNFELKDRVAKVEHEFANYKVLKSKESDELIKLLQKVRLDSERTIASWKTWSKSVLAGCVNVERISNKSRDTVLGTIESGNAKIAATEKDYDEKIKKLRKYFKKTKGLNI